MADALVGLRSIPSQSAAEMSRWTEYGWLEERIKALRAELAEIVKCSAGDDDTENGIANLYAAIDDFGRRMSRLDEGGMKMAYDQKCYDLGALFLGDVDGSTEDDRKELAQAIQDVIEEHCREVARSTEAYMSRAE